MKQLKKLVRAVLRARGFRLVRLKSKTPQLLTTAEVRSIVEKMDPGDFCFAPATREVTSIGV